MQTRKSSRAIVLNKQNQIFLFRYIFDFFAEQMTAGKWWSVEEIRQSEEKFFSADVVGILERLARGEIPEKPEEIT